MMYIDPYAHARGKQTERQRAMQQGVGDVTNAIGAYHQMQQNQEQAAKTRNVEKFKLESQLAQQGVQVTPEMQEQIGQAVDSGDYGSISAIFNEPMAQRANQRMAREEEKYQMGLEDRDYKRAMNEEDRRMRQAELAQRRAQQERSFGLQQQKLSESQAKGRQLKQPTASEFQAAGFAKRARLAEESLKGLSPTVGTSFFGEVGSDIADIIPYGEGLKTEERKKFENTKNNFISAVLRKESGAAISDDEYEREERKYFPQVGDDEAELAQKEQLRNQAVLNLEGEGRRALPLVGSAVKIDPEQRTIQRRSRIEELRAKQRKGMVGAN